jgi:hypothetical protein
MNEAEFRDWARAALRQLDLKLKALTARVDEPAKPAAPDQRVQGDIGKLIETLTAQAKAGQVRGLAIAFVNEAGTTMSGYAAEGGYFQLAGAATFLGLEILEDYRKSEAANDDHPADGAEADPAPAQG